MFDQLKVKIFLRNGFTKVHLHPKTTIQVTEQCIPIVQGVQTLSLNMFFCSMFLSFALALRWSLVFSAGLGFVLVLLMDPDWSWGAAWRRWG